jgi:hypothetical protein
MTIRKTGAADGRITVGTDPSALEEPQPIAPVTATCQETGAETEVSWAPRDERDLALENEAADVE